MKIAYLSSFSNLEVSNWSGLELNIFESLKSTGAEIDFIGTKFNDNLIPKIIGKSNQVLYSLFKKKYLGGRTVTLAKSYANTKSKLINNKTDVIFSPGSIQIAYLDTIKPKVIFTDATFAGMIGYYKEFSNLSEKTIKIGNTIEQQAFDNANLLFFASEWAAESAIKFYNIKPEKTRIVPFGANVTSNRTKGDIENINKSKSSKIIKLLFAGVDWKRKGGDKALKVTEELNKMGIKTELHVVGISELPFSILPDYIINHGYISKSTIEGRNKLDQLYTQSHFLILPTQAECFGIVFSEASSFGVPSISTNTGGVPSAIKNYKNGITFNLDETIEAYVDFIIKFGTNPIKYQELSLSSFNEYETRLNWQSIGKNMNLFLKELI